MGSSSDPSSAMPDCLRAARSNGEGEEPAEPPVTHGNNASPAATTGRPPATSPLEHLVAGGQGVIAKRIDLALLEGQELFSRSIERAALAGAGTALGAAAWLAGAAAFVLWMAPDSGPVGRLAAFALLNGAGAVGFVTLAVRHNRPPAREPRNGNRPVSRRESLPAEAENRP